MMRVNRNFTTFFLLVMSVASLVGSERVNGVTRTLELNSRIKADRSGNTNAELNKKLINKTVADRAQREKNPVQRS
jgi:hypothetical protein